MKKPAEQNICQNTALDTQKSKLSSAIKVFVENEDAKFSSPKEIVIICFGTPLIAGDAFAPIVASELRDSFDVPFFVYGTPEYSVNGKNMDEWMDFISCVHKGCALVAVDASLGAKVGDVVVRKDGVCPAAVKGRKKRVGDLGILGIVGKLGEDPLSSLLEADFGFVENMALDTAKALSFALKEI